MGREWIECWESLGRDWGESVERVGKGWGEGEERVGREWDCKETFRALMQTLIPPSSSTPSSPPDKVITRYAKVTL